MGKFFVFVLICAGIGMFMSPALGIIIFLGGLLATGLFAIMK